MRQVSMFSDLCHVGRIRIESKKCELSTPWSHTGSGTYSCPSQRFLPLAAVGGIGGLVSLHSCALLSQSYGVYTSFLS